VPLETQVALAQPHPDGKLTLWSSTQIPHYLHRIVSKVLGMREQDVRVIKPDVGAGYGGKSDPFANELCAAALARKTGRPVKFILDREEVFYAHRGRHPTRMTLKMGITNDGRITAADFKAWAAGGAYASYGVVTAYYFGVFLPLPY
jgi:CO/xanthine dehydrogenase Mo-binding subunit